MIRNTGLYTDYYELLMAQGYFLQGLGDAQVGFDYFFRSSPFGGGYAIFAGLEDLIEDLNKFTFCKEDLDFLRTQGFHHDFLESLKSFRFRGDLYSASEGEVVFPNEPILRVQGGLIETQLIESLILNLINFQTLIATKASRIRHVVGDRILIDFGLRRAQGYGSIHASRASIIGGIDSTSNVLGAFQYGIKPAGTMAHSWIQSFESEIEAFRAYASLYPDNCILLVDTYNTLKSGIPNAIIIAHEMNKKGQRMTGVRLDSGDLAYLSKNARKLLDDAGLQHVKIVVSNQLDEYIIRSLLEQKAPIDAFGVGTKLVIGSDDGALDGVYKLTSFNNQPRMKISENIEKIILPGRKNVLRYFEDGGTFFADAITLEDEPKTEIIYHPIFQSKSTHLEGKPSYALIKPVLKKGELICELSSAIQAAAYAKERLKLLPKEHKRFENPHVYRIGISKALLQLRNKLIKQLSEPD